MPLAFTLTVYFARGGEMTGYWGMTWLATAVLAMVISAAYAINDVVDVEPDRINAPTRPIPAGRISRRAGSLLGGGLWIAGVGLSLLVESTQFRVVFAGVAILLLLYDFTSKHLGLLKQLIVAVLTTSIYPLAIALSDGAHGSRAWSLLPFAIWVFLLSFAYELLKDIRDRKGDALVFGRRNAVQRHPRTWMLVASWLIALGGLALIGPALLGCQLAYWLALPLLAIIVGRAAMARHGETKLQLIFAEFVVVGVFTTLDVIIFGF